MEYISGRIVDVVGRKVFKGVISFEDGVIRDIRESDSVDDCFLMPGLVDAHVHVESSLLPPAEFARVAMRQGALAAVADPHEIANVMGVAGVEYMVAEAKSSPFRFLFAAPSCVPATDFETSGARIDTAEIEQMFSSELVGLLGEMMNFPGVVNGDLAVLAKIDAAKRYSKPIDGHAPGLSGDMLARYVGAGIGTDHECVSIVEAIEKIRLGMKVLIRQGSAANNLDELAPLIGMYPDKVMLCTDDMHAEEILNGYLRSSLKYLVEKCYDIFDILRSCTLIPVGYYGLDLGLLQVGDSADFIKVDNLCDFNVQSVFVRGFEIGIGEMEKPVVLNNFKAESIVVADLRVKRKGDSIRVIGVINGELLTKQYVYKLKGDDKFVESNADDDVLKIVVVCRYDRKQLFVGFVKGFGIKKGAVATSISHDSHNIIAVGVSDDDLLSAINAIIDAKGGICFSRKGEVDLLPLPIAGLMSDKSAEYVAEKYASIEKLIKANGSRLSSPLMNLSFLALLVIPDLKINERGLFDFKTFAFVDLFV